MGSSLCSRLRKWRKHFSAKKTDDRETLNVNGDVVDREESSKEKLREILKEEDVEEIRVASQTKEDLRELIEDLKQQLAKHRCNKPEKEKLLLELGHAHYKLCKFPSAKDYYEQYFSLVKRQRSLIHLQRAYCNLGCVHRRLGDFVKATEYFEKGLAIAEELQNKSCQARMYNNLGNISEMQQDFEGAIYYQSQRRKIAESLKDGNSVSKANASIANAYHCLGNLRASIAYYERVVLWLRRKLGKRRCLCKLQKVLSGSNIWTLKYFNKEKKYKAGEL